MVPRFLLIRNIEYHIISYNPSYSPILIGYDILYDILKDRRTIDATITKFNSLLYKTNRFHVACASVQ